MTDAHSASASNMPPEDSSTASSHSSLGRFGKLPVVILTAVVALLVIAATWSYLATRDVVSTDDAQIDGDAIAIQTKVSGYVSQLDISDNERVNAGQLLFRIDPRDYIASRDQAKASLAQAQAYEENAAANLAMTRVSAPAKLWQAQAQVRSATASRDYAASDFDRQTSVDPHSTSQQSIDLARQNLQSSKASLANNEAQLAAAKLVPQTIAQARAQLDQARAQVAQAKAQLATAELTLSYTNVRAPQDGWVTQRNVQLGSYVTAGQSAFSLVAPIFWVTANFKENQLARMRVGQKVAIKVDAYNHMRLEGHVQSLQMGTGSRFSAFPAENATGNYIKIVQRLPVKIAIDRGIDPNLPLPLGLSVSPTVDLK